MTEKKSKIHYAWWIFIGCCCIGFGGYSLVYGFVGIYFLPVSESLGIGIDDITLWLIIDALVEVVVSPFAGKLMERKNLGLFMTLGGASVVLGLFGFAMASSAWMIWLCGVLIGLGMPFLYGIPQYTLIGNWFAPKYQGRFTGIAMGCMGLSTIAFSPLFTLFIDMFGWQTTYMINAIFSAILILPFTIFVFKRSPQDMGMLPYGADEEDVSDISAEEDISCGASIKTAIKSAAFWLVLIGIMVPSFGFGFIELEPSIADEFLVPEGLMDVSAAAMVGALMISLSAAGNFVGSVGFGFLSDKVGLGKSLILYLIVWPLSFLLWFAFHTPVALYIGAFLIGLQDGIICCGLPILARRLFGNKNYPAIWAYANLTNVLLGNASAYLIAFGYEDVFGGYMPILMIAFGMSVVAGICTFVAYKRIGTIKWEGEDKEKLPAAA